MQFVLLAPGPSMSQAVADSVRGCRAGVVTSAYPLAPWADFLAATDAGWWLRTPDAKRFAGDKYSAGRIGDDVTRISTDLVTSSTNSGVLALEVAKQRGATKILLLGFDHHGTHYFGPYTNGLRNTPERRRLEHMRQFEQWGRANKGIEIFNCTPGSALKCFPMARLDDCLAELAAPGSGSDGSVHGGIAAAGI